MCPKSTLKTEFLLGNEAIALGALCTGVRFAASYPGTPASEILPAFFAMAERFGVEVHGGWMVNEKVAFEAALAASWCGINAMVSMKQVGLNVAMDPLMSAAYTGTEGGFLVVSVDDPGPYSSQTEQDSRFMAMAAKVPVFDPCNPQDAFEIMEEALNLSRRFQILVMVRPVLRVSHSRQSVRFEEPCGFAQKPDFKKKPGVWTATPKFRLQLHRVLNEKIEEIATEGTTYIEEQLNRVKGNTVFIASGALYGYLLDLGVENVIRVKMPYPLDQSFMLRIAKSFSTVWVIEETYPVIELQIPSRENVRGRLSGHIPPQGEITLQKLKEIIDPAETKVFHIQKREKKPRLCPGCGHRPVFYAMRRSFSNGIFPGDIGCYTLGTNIGAVDTFLCMGASISMGLSFALLEERPVVCTIGDSTFFHSGIPPLIEAVEKGAPMVVAVLDNGTTAMTGGQPIPSASIEEIARSCGVRKVERVHAYSVKEVMEKLKECWRFSVDNRTPSLLHCLCPCVLYGEKPEEPRVPTVDAQKCTGCGICYRIFECPAIEERDGKAFIDQLICTGCGVCEDICPSGAIHS